MSIKLLQFSYDENLSMPIEEDFYKRIIEDIDYFRISPQVYYILKEQDKLKETPYFFQEHLKHKYKKTFLTNLFIKSELEKLFSQFEERTIDMIPLKGVLFAEKYFGNLGARGTSDIDILIKTKDIENTIKCVKDLGFKIEEEPISSHFHCSFSKELPGSKIPLTVEIHWNILKEKTANFQIEELWIEAAPLKGYKHIKELSDYHTFYMICLHGWRHNLDSLKYFFDIIQLIYCLKDKIDYTRLIKDAAAHRTLKRIKRTLSIVYQQYPGLEDVKRFSYRTSPIWWEYNSFRNKESKNLKKYVDFLDYQLLSYDCAKHSLIELCNLIIPSKTLRS